VDGVRVLVYHAIDDPDPHDRLALRVSPQRFLEQMTLLRDEGYAVVPLDSVFDPHGENHSARVAITFDDGYSSQAWAAEVLRDFGFPATFFVVPRFLDGVRAPAAYWEAWGHLGWAEAAALVDGGFEIGAHSATHPDLRQCTNDQLEREVLGAKRVLEDRLRKDVESFSYPHGRHNSRVRQEVKRAGYQIGCTSRYGVNRPSRAPFSIHRTEVTGADTLQDFRWKLQGRYDWFGYWQDMTLAR
jgi:peptidoglycan/xylan/chitin deacetylase (PgdA/CDA1 family)